MLRSRSTALPARWIAASRLSVFGNVKLGSSLTNCLSKPSRTRAKDRGNLAGPEGTFGHCPRKLHFRLVRKSADAPEIGDMSLPTNDCGGAALLWQPTQNQCGGLAAPARPTSHGEPCPWTGSYGNLIARSRR